MKLEYADLKEIGITEKALNVYNNSDFEFDIEDEKIFCKINGDIFFENGTPKDVEELLMEFAVKIKLEYAELKEMGILEKRHSK